MNLKQLKAFREVMLTGSVSKAARSLFRSQPAISAVIADLENEIGYKLFERRGRRLHPLPEAHFLFEEAKEIIGRLDSAERMMKEARHLETGTIHIATMLGPSVFLLPELISRFLDGRSGVRVSLITRNSAEVERLISAQQFDLGLADVSYEGFSKSPLVSHDLQPLPCLCAVASNDPLAENDVITPSDLSGSPLGMLYEEHLNTQHIKQAFDASGARLNIRIQTQYFIPLLSFVARSHCYAIVDPLSAFSYEKYYADAGGVVFRPFSPTVHLVASIMVPAHKSTSQLVSLLIAELKNELSVIAAMFD